MTSFHDDDVFSGANSRYLNAGKRSSSRKSPSTNGRRSPSLRGSALAQSLEDDTANGRHSLAHELAYALMPESGGSKLLAEELGLEYDEGAQGIDQATQPGDDVEHAHAEDITPDTFGSSSQQQDDQYGMDSPSEFDPAFDTPSKPQRQTRLPEQDPMVMLAEDLESTDKFLSHLRRLDAEQSGQPNLERLASDMIRRIDDTAREREGQVRELLEYEREFRRISGEIGGDDVLGQLDELEDLITEGTRPDPSPLQENHNKLLDAIREEEDPHSILNGAGWEPDLDHDRTRLGDDEDEYDGSSPSPTPIKSNFATSLPTNILPTPKATVVQLGDLRSFTATVASSLATISEHTQVNAAATTEAGRKIRALKNKMGGWQAEWESAERSRAKIERWEAGVTDVGEGTLVVISLPGTPTRSGRSRVDGRKIVKEHLESFERVLLDANQRTQTIIAAVS